MSKSVISEIEGMTKHEFHVKIIKSFIGMTEFGHLVSFGAEDLSPEERKKVCDTLKTAGLSVSSEITDEELNEIADSIASRSVQVR